MSDFDQGCRKKGWAVGAAAGLVVALFGLTVGHIGLLGAVFLGVITFLLFGAFLVWAFCDGSQIALEPPKAAQPVMPVLSEAPVAAAPAPAPTPVPAPEPKAEPAPEPAAPAAALMAEPVAVSAPVAAPEAAPAKPAKARKAKTEAAKTEAPAKAPKAKKAAKTAPDGKPAGLKAPRKGGADDLKLIEGIGPKLEEKLNDWGIYHFDQIAKWGAAEVAYADENVPRFKGRCSRDKWVAQAKIIVEEGLDAFLIRAKTNDY